MIHIFNERSGKFQPSEEPRILYRSLGQTGESGPIRLENMLKERGIKSKAQLFLNGNLSVRNWGAKTWEEHWTDKMVRERYGRIINSNFDDKNFHDEYEQAVLDEVEVRGPTPLISTRPDRNWLYNYYPGPVIAFTTDGLRGDSRYGVQTLVVLNEIPSSSLIEVVSYDKRETEEFGRVLKKYDKKNVEVTEFTWQELGLLEGHRRYSEVRERCNDLDGVPDPELPFYLREPGIFDRLANEHHMRLLKRICRS